MGVRGPGSYLHSLGVVGVTLETYQPSRHGILFLFGPSLKISLVWPPIPFCTKEKTKRDPTSWVHFIPRDH